MPVGNAHLLNIPAGEKDHVIILNRATRQDAMLYRIYVHGHFLFRRATVTATLPDGKVLNLVNVWDWDLNAQDTYDYVTPVHIPAGTKIRLEGHFDNSENNPQNPNKPPKFVRSGPNSTDEMFGALLYMKVAGAQEPLILKEPLKGPVLRRILPPEGIIAPGDFLRAQYDKDGDGLINAEEMEAIPAMIRAQIVLKHLKSTIPFLGFSESGEPPILLNKSVQEELKMTPDQVRQLALFDRNLHRQYQKDVDDINELEPDVGLEKAEKMVNTLKKLSKNALSQILTGKQKIRFRQIQIQQQGLVAFFTPEAISVLKLTKEQRAKYRELSAEASKAKEAFQHGDLDYETALAKHQALRRETQAKALAILSPEQMMEWTRLAGPPFEIRPEGTAQSASAPPKKEDLRGVKDGPRR
jgi:hypothetical protein